MTTLVCPDCQSAAVNEIGPIPPASVFAGHALEKPLPGGLLARCVDCALTFRSPIYEPAFYDNLYSTASASEWQSEETRFDHRLLAQALQRHINSGDVLDVGCGAGALLSLLPERFRRFGLEISADARLVAAGRGIEMVASQFDELMTIGARFDAVLACDVIEHHAQPSRFIEQCLAAVKPGGLLLLSTGNPDATLWKIARGNFWYCQFIEHLTFISRRWLERRASTYNIKEIREFAYGALTFKQKTKAWARLVHYHLAPGSYAKRVARIKGWRGPLPYHPNPPGMGLTRDHIIVVLSKAQ